MVALQEKQLQRPSAEQIAAMQEEARQVAKERLGAAVCGMCPIAEMCQAKGTGDCASGGPEAQELLTTGGDYDSGPVSYKKDLLDDSKSLVFADLRRKTEEPKKPIKKVMQKPPRVERPAPQNQKTIAEKFAEAVVAMIVSPTKDVRNAPIKLSAKR